ncbi:MAG: sugar phosphate isomerase/epimerase, partial [Pontibacter sp.]|nr:sugar phosphate isomerase/epimerase [Pontibacter sp.]
MASSKKRRDTIKGILAGTASLTVAGVLPTVAASASSTKAAGTGLKGNVNHSVCRWCFSNLSVEELCVAAKGMGITGVDLVGPKDWPVLKKHGLESTMCNGAEINLEDGWNDKRFHATLIRNYSEMIPQVAKAGYKNLICFSGNRRGKSDEEGWQNCVEGLKQVLPLAEKHSVTLVMELLNSK